MESKLKGYTSNGIHGMKRGLKKDDVLGLRARYGENRIEIEKVPVLKMLATKGTQVFYLFQIASVSICTLFLIAGLWQEYITYALVILVVSLASVIWEVYNCKTNEISLRRLTEESFKMYVIRNSQIVRINSNKLVIGDMVILDDGFLTSHTLFPCDFILLQGEIVCDESSLTGETVPIVKLPLPHNDDVFNPERSKTNILYGGSVITKLKILPKGASCVSFDFGDDLKIELESVNNQENSFRKSINKLKSKPTILKSSLENSNLPDIKKSAIAVVFSTGFSTSKGELFRSILFPSEVVTFFLMIGISIQ
jgi:magnesium-transporting ATPase (P-type)